MKGFAREIAVCAIIPARVQYEQRGPSDRWLSLQMGTPCRFASRIEGGAGHPPVMHLRCVLFWALAATVGSGCAEADSDPVDSGRGSSGGSSDSGSLASGRIEGTFVFVDGTEVDFDRPAIFRTQEILGTTQSFCEATDSEARLSLAVVWPTGTTAGPYALSLGDGPYLIAAWPHAEGSGVRATSPQEGNIMFTELGDASGDLIRGSADATLMPDPRDPDERVQEIVDVRFSCVVD